MCNEPTSTTSARARPPCPRRARGVAEPAPEDDGLTQGVRPADRVDDVRRPDRLGVDDHVAVAVREGRGGDDPDAVVDLDRLCAGVTQLLDAVEQGGSVDGAVGVGDRDVTPGPIAATAPDRIPSTARRSCPSWTAADRRLELDCSSVLVFSRSSIWVLARSLADESESSRSTRSSRRCPLKSSLECVSRIWVAAATPRMHSSTATTSWLREGVRSAPGTAAGGLVCPLVRPRPAPRGVLRPSLLGRLLAGGLWVVGHQIRRGRGAVGWRRRWRRSGCRARRRRRSRAARRRRAGRRGRR